ncbi:hypothetical protein [Pseudoalteromonas luteoviolacea]|uniref:hypothetical protein n=1 Tax=Pseudoalteromonas luteoviolacea TaxID=43657 RepID=UPI001153BBBE|nr:hypothetical protein [Pseudoalteromonas luteoviolacea]TQF71794.1 hypothetical protein FLM44_12225 [Pseudoalteromonas luteoviolacea]
MTLDEIKILVSVEAVQNSLDSQLFETLTYDSPHKVPTAIDKAAAWAYSKLIQGKAQNNTFNNDELSLLTEAMCKMAIYELYSLCEFEGSAEEKRKDAYVIINALLGMQSDEQSVKRTAKISVSKDANQSFNPYHPSIRR